VLIKSISVKDSAALENQLNQITSKSAFHGFQEMLGGGENHFVIMQVTFCQTRHLRSFSYSSVGHRFCIRWAARNQRVLHPFPANSIAKQSNGL